MKLKRSLHFNQAESTDMTAIYDLSVLKFIRVDHKKDNEITSIALVDLTNGFENSEKEFRAEGLVYLENVCHGEENEILDTNLLILAEGMFEEVC